MKESWHGGIAGENMRLAKARWQPIKA